MTVLSNVINNQLIELRNQFENCLNRQISDWFIPLLYTTSGCALLIVIPTVVFTMVEHWSILESVYFALISLSTIGLGDMVPMLEPPVKYATTVRNDTACFSALVDPIPSSNISKLTGISTNCDPVSIVNS